MDTFLHWIGAYNVVGPVVLMLMHRDAVADLVLRRATETVTVPFVHGMGSRMWLWWAASTNLFMGVIMVRAASWPPDVQREVIAGAVCVYAIMLAVLVVAHRAGGMGRGVWVTYGLWVAQIAWGVATLVR